MTNRLARWTEEANRYANASDVVNMTIVHGVLPWIDQHLFLRGVVRIRKTCSIVIVTIIGENSGVSIFFYPNETVHIRHNTLITDIVSALPIEAINWPAMVKFLCKEILV